MDLLRLVVDLRRIAPTTATNALTIKDTPERIAAAASRAVGHRQGASRSHHRRRAAGGRSDEAARVRAADRIARLALASTARSSPESGNQRHADASRSLRNLTQSDCAALPICRRCTTGCSRPTPIRGRWPTPSSERRKAWRRRRGSASKVPVPSGDLHADRHRRHTAATDRVVPVRNHRREHRHHAAHASRRRRDAGPQGGGDEHFRRRLRRAAHLRQPGDQHRHPLARRRNQHAGRPDSRRRASGRGRHSRPEPIFPSSGACSGTRRRRRSRPTSS